MHIQLLGTAAAEGIPAPFCRCRVCEYARKHGGKNIRSQTSALIDGVLKIDMPPDTWHHTVTHGLNWCGVKDLFFTHSHGDHLCVEPVIMRLPGFSNDCTEPLVIYGNETVLGTLRAPTQSSPEHIQRRLLRAFEPVVAQTATVTPLPADHIVEENCFLLWIERLGKTFFYAHDSGWFPEKTWAWLEGKRADGVLLECTMGDRPNRRGHLGVEALLEASTRLREIGVIDRNTTVVATHFSHNGHLHHEELESRLNPAGIQTAFDGIKIAL